MFRGALLVILSAVAFSLATVFVKSAHLHAEIPAMQVTFFRFLVGFLIVGGYTLASRRSIRPRRAGVLVLRSAMNFASVIFLYLGIQYSTVTTANMLNMTFPVFVFLIAPHINRERSRGVQYLFLATTMAGIYMIVFPGFRGFNPADLFGLLSGITAAFAVSLLREVGKHESSHVIIFYLMTVGLVLGAAIGAPSFIVPGPKLLLILILSASFGFLGQILITVAFRTVDAATGSLLSASRILFAAALGSALFSDPITPRIVLGGVLILISLIGTSGVVGLPTGSGLAGRLRADRTGPPEDR